MSLCGYQGGAEIPQGTALMPLAGWHSFLLIRPCHGQPRSQIDQPFRPRLPGFGHLLPGRTFLPTPTQRFLLASCLGAPPPRSLPSLRVSLPPVPRRNCFGGLCCPGTSHTQLGASRGLSLRSTFHLVGLPGPPIRPCEMKPQAQCPSPAQTSWSLLLGLPTAVSSRNLERTWAGRTVKGILQV